MRGLRGGGAVCRRRAPDSRRPPQHCAFLFKVMIFILLPDARRAENFLEPQIQILDEVVRVAGAPDVQAARLVVVKDVVVGRTDNTDGMVDINEAGGL